MNRTICPSRQHFLAVLVAIGATWAPAPAQEPRDARPSWVPTAETETDPLATGINVPADLERHHRDEVQKGLFTLKPPVLTRSVEEPPAGTSIGAAEGDPWVVSLMPFLWVPGMAGEVEVRGVGDSFDYDPIESAEAVIDNFDFAAQAQLHIGKGPWFVELTGMYLGLSNEKKGRLIDVEVEFEQVILQVMGGYRLVQAPLDEKAGLSGPTFSLAAMAGGRYFSLGVDIDLDPGPSADKNKDWFDPLVGLRASLSLSPEFAFVAGGAIGGFGVGSDFTWQFQVGIEWSLSDCFSLVAGWADMDIDYDSGNFEFDVLFYGPYLGGRITF